MINVFILIHLKLVIFTVGNPTKIFNPTAVCQSAGRDQDAGLRIEFPDWDGLLGNADKPNDVKREVEQLRAKQLLWKVDTGGMVEDWIQEGHELAKSFTYSPLIIEATEQPGELQRINLPEGYLKEAGEHARARVVAAGLRLGSTLKDIAEGK